jgi:chromosome partitioning protein
VVRPPLAGQHMVLDTPGGLRGFDLARVVMYADAVLMPVCNSAFDRESAADCVAELRTLPRVASGRCRLAAVGMRIDARTKAAEVLRRWAEELDLGFVGVLRDTQTYVRCVEDGLTLFDLAPAKVAQDLAQWQPILDWLAPLLQPAATAPMRAAAPPVAAPMPLSLLREPPPEQRMAASSGTPMHTAVAVSPSAGPASGAAPAALTRERVAGAPPLTLRRPAAPAAPSPARPTRIGRLLGALQIPRFLQRAP